jgi:hypothetical protein
MRAGLSSARPPPCPPARPQLVGAQQGGSSAAQRPALQPDWHTRCKRGYLLLLMAGILAAPGGERGGPALLPGASWVASWGVCSSLLP